VTGTGAQLPPQIYRGYASEEAVTGEGVALELPVANVGSRIVSGLIDIVANVLLLFGLLWAVGSLVSGHSFAVNKAAGLVVMVTVLVGVPATCETLTRGRTLGKLVMGLRVVRDDGGPVSARHAGARALVGFVEIYATAGMVALMAGLANSRVKRLGDLTAGSYVTSERTKLVLPPGPAMPPELAQWAAAADIASLDQGLSVALRQFLPRAHTLLPAARDQVGAQLLASVLQRVAPMPPPGHHAETVLRAVAAERYRRELGKLQREQQLRDTLLPRG
jgi:uncharacterized RDD family membrane protein YckC